MTLMIMHEGKLSFKILNNPKVVYNSCGLLTVAETQKTEIFFPRKICGRCVLVLKRDS